MSDTKRNILIFVAMILFILGGLVYYLLRGDTAQLTTEQLSGPAPVITEPREETFPTINVAEVTGWAGGTQPTPADGLAVNRFVEGLDHPRSMLALPNGDVLVAETNSPPRENKGIEGWIMRLLMDRAGAGTPSANRIRLLRDNDGDGVAESNVVLLEDLNSPFGMEVIGDKLYVANTDALMAYPFEVGDTKIEGKGEKIVELSASKPNNHWTRNIIASADGKKMYVAVGSASNIAEKGLDVEAGRAMILEVDLESRKAIPYSVGLRNPVGMDIHPASDTLWTVVNERDMLGSDLAPDYLARVDIGTHFGWPWIYWGKHEDLRVVPRRVDLIEYTRRPDYALGAHVAPLGLVFAEDAKLGAPFESGAFIALHGSWNRKPAAGYKVIFVPFTENGQPDVQRDEEGNVTGGLPIDVLTGFLDKDGDAQGRPTMVAIDGTGALLVTDDVSGIIWRVQAGKTGNEDIVSSAE
ncbi:sorbosone dehydrogenase family protein [Sphingorhabdus sp. Alg239-R122]|uniref:PQQ-dependent sugar dehydrogenase n=1 Tax=Sphingorhabdus sp. Alg239-R122 TaxID=2305989 RepID=UPI0013DD648C|nr:sorbosone dehydrogenase family protein [Sphingorhabdus sp. Alg239-R122]